LTIRGTEETDTSSADWAEQDNCESNISRAPVCDRSERYQERRSSAKMDGCGIRQLHPQSDTRNRSNGECSFSS
jgi:hypothetical protein